MDQPTLAQCETSASMGETKENDVLVGQRVFAIPHQHVDALREGFSVSKTNLWPHGSYSPTPYLYRYRLEPGYPGRPGFARVTSWYRTPRIRWPSVEEGKLIRGVLTHDFGGQVRKLFKEPVGQQRRIQGLVESSESALEHKLGVEYQVVSGTPDEVLCHGWWRIEALAIASYNPTFLKSLVGQTNSGPIFGGHVPAETARFFGMRSTKPYGTSDDDAFWQIELVFEERPEGFWVEVSKRWPKVVRSPVYAYDTGEALDGVYREMTVLAPYPGEEGSVYPRDTTEAVDFSVFDQILELA